MISRMPYNTSREAEKALLEMTAIAEDCGVATIADLYSVSGIVEEEMSVDFGWYPLDMTKAYVEEFNGRYFLRLGRAQVVEEFY